MILAKSISVNMISEVFLAKNALDKSRLREICWKSTRGTKALKTHSFLRTTDIPERILSGQAGKRSWK